MEVSASVRNLECVLHSEYLGSFQRAGAPGLQQEEEEESSGLRTGWEGVPDVWEEVWVHCQ